MGDVKDILGLPSRNNEPKEVKPKEAKQERPKGVSREAYSLLYGSHPITPANLLKEVKKEEERPAPLAQQVTYQFMPFKNEARTDSLQLYHWTRCYRDAVHRVREANEGEEYPYSKYNKKVLVYKYDAVEFETVIRPKFPEDKTGWSKEETDYLLEKCDRLDLRFIVIADHWDYPGTKRSVEDLKERYYSMAAEMLINREGSRDLVGNSPIVRQRYDAQRERERKALLQMQYTRSQQQTADEDEILAKADLIYKQRKAQAEAKQSEGAPLMYPESFSNSVTELPFFDRNVIPIAPPKPGVYMRRAMTEDSLKKAIQEAPMQQQRVQKALDAIISDVAKIKGQPVMMTRGTGAMWLALHSEALIMVNMQQRHNKMALPVEDGRGKRSSKSKTPRYDDSSTGGPMTKRQRAGK